MADDERALEPIESIRELSPQTSDHSTARPAALTTTFDWPEARGGTAGSEPRPFPDFVDEPQSYYDDIR